MRNVLSAFLFVGVTGAVVCYSEPAKRIRGRTTSNDMPVAGTIVRIQGTKHCTRTNKDGRFRFDVATKRKRVTAWKNGFAIAAAPLNASPIRLNLVPLPKRNNPNYRWIDPYPNAKRKNNCANCHRKIFDEWQTSAHARAATNRRLLNLVGGTDSRGRVQRTWSVKHEFPLGTGVCASCHAPTYRDPDLVYDLQKTPGVAARGVHCDYCHKIVGTDVTNLGVTFGKDGYALLRPKDGVQLFFGPLDDAHREGEQFGYSPLYKDSKFCASCHEGVVFGVHVYGTYSEWLKSPAKQRGRHCQDCHMKPTGTMTNIAPGHGGVERDPQTLASHVFPGGTEAMLRGCLDVKTTLAEKTIRIVVTANNVGHRVPTGFIDRHLVLLVEAWDAEGRKVAQRTGPTLPSAVGGEWSGQAGKLYAKLLHDRKGRAPIPFWRPHGKIVDTRLHPDRPDRASFTFKRPITRGRVRVIYRRFWQETVRAKRWPEDDVIVVDRTIRR